MTISCNRDTFSTGCRSSVDSLSGLTLGGGGELLESLTRAVFPPRDSAALDLFSDSDATPSLLSEDLKDLLFVGRVGLLVLGRRPRPRPDEGRRTRFSFSLFSSGAVSPSGLTLS